MSTVDSTGTTRGSTHPIVAELIRDEIANWFGQQHPYPDVKETISSEALSGMLTRVADRSYAAGSTATVAPELDGRLIEAGVHLEGISAAFTLLADHARLSDDIMSPGLLASFEIMMGGVVAAVKETLAEAHRLLQGRAP